MATAASPITQVSQTQTGGLNLAGGGQPQLLARLQLDLRGVRFSVDREKIMNLPESVLLCLFPNGLVLSRQSIAGSSGYDEEEGEDVYIVDVSWIFAPAANSIFTSNLHSLIQTASLTSSSSSVSLKIAFMVLLQPLAYLPPSKPFLNRPRLHPRPEWTLVRLTRTRF
jgi:hypothetical protein